MGLNGLEGAIRRVQDGCKGACVVVGVYEAYVDIREVWYDGGGYL